MSAVHSGGALTAAIRSGEEEVFSSEGNCPQRPLSGAVVDLQQTVFGITCESTPS